MLQVLSLGLFVPGKSTDNVAALFECLRRHHFVVDKRIKWIAEPTQSMELARFVSHARENESGLATFHLKHEEANSVGGILQWYGPRDRTKERPFDQLGFTSKTTSQQYVEHLPVVLRELCELFDAVYGHLSPWDPGYERQLHAKPQQAILHGLPSIMPVTYLRRDLFDYVGIDRWRKSSLRVAPAAKGVLLMVPDWSHTTNDVLDRIQDQVGAKFFFHGSDWNDYPKSPLFELERRLPAGRARRGRNN